METKLFTVETVRTIWENREIVDKFEIGKSYFSEFEAAKHRAEVMHKAGIKLHRETDGNTSTDVWVFEYDKIGAEFFHKGLRGHYTSADADTAATGLVFSHCE